MQIPPKKWNDHEQGQCYCFDGKTFINISKNASSTMKASILSTYNIKQEQYSNYYNDGVRRTTEDYIVLLRDPLERWVSGYLEFVKRNPTNIGDLNYPQLIYDEHTDTQSYFLNFEILEWDKIRFFYVGEDLITRINNCLDLKLHTVENRNVQNNSKKRDLMQFLGQNYPDFLDRVYETYADDYALISEVNKEQRLW